MITSHLFPRDVQTRSSGNVCTHGWFPDAGSCMAGMRATARPEIGLQLPTAVETSRIAPNRTERKAGVPGVPIDRARLCSAQVFSFLWLLALVWDSTPS